jgi:hypothetical protein
VKAISLDLDGSMAFSASLCHAFAIVQFARDVQCCLASSSCMMTCIRRPTVFESMS